MVSIDGTDPPLVKRHELHCPGCDAPRTNPLKLAAARSSIDKIDGLHRDIWAFALTVDALNYARVLKQIANDEVAYLKAGVHTSNLLAYIPRSGISTG
jgi:hypothetical protein